MVAGDQGADCMDGGVIAAVLDALISTSADGRINQAAFDAALAEHALPARWFRALTAEMKLAGLTVTAAPEPVLPLDAPPPERDPGWNVVGQDAFIKRNWHPLLTAEEEHDLGVIVQRGRLARQALEDANAPPDGLRPLRRLVKIGERAEERMVLANLRLVTKLAWKLKRQGGPAMEMEDLFQEGVIGLTTAIAKFDPERGLKLSTYATWWIRQSMTRAIADKTRVVRLPVHKFEQVRSVWKAGEELRSAGRPSTPSDVAAFLGITEYQVQECHRVSQAVRSLDRPVGSGTATLGELLADPVGGDPGEIAVARAMENAVKEAMAGLSEREKQVMRLRFGLDDGRRRTLEEVGEEFGVTRERIRQIEAKTLRRLRDPARHAKLHDFVDFRHDLDAKVANDRRGSKVPPSHDTKEN